jgi:glycosyltransferase involved in cell wall biosynthesis
MTLPLVSIIFISYKRIDLLKKTFQSFLSNTAYPNLELILCDDGSPPEIQKEMKSLPFNKFLFASKNEGLASNTNKGILNAKGDFIFQLQDDWIINGPSNYLQMGIEAFNVKQELGILRYRIKNHEKFIYSETLKLTPDDNLIIINEDNDIILKYRNRIYSDTPHLKRKTLHEKIGLYKNVRKFENIELDFCNRISSQVLFKVGFLDNYKEIFEHIGESESFRTNTLKNKIIKNVAENKLGRILYSTAKKILRL